MNTSQPPEIRHNPVIGSDQQSVPSTAIEEASHSRLRDRIGRFAGVVVTTAAVSLLAPNMAAADDTPPTEGVSMSALAVGSKVNFNKRGACIETPVWESPSDREKLKRAQQCEEYGFNGPLHFMDLSKTRKKPAFVKMGKSIVKGLEKATDGEVRPTSVIMFKPTKKANKAVKNELRNNKKEFGYKCVDITDTSTMLSSIVRDKMPKKTKRKPNLLVWTDSPTCPNRPSALAAADKASSIDMYLTGSYSKRELIQAAIHEKLHNLLVEHFGTWMPGGMNGGNANQTIPEDHIRHDPELPRVLDLETYLNNGTYNTYKYKGDNVMGATNDAIRFQALNRLQEWFLGKSKRIINGTNDEAVQGVAFTEATEQQQLTEDTTTIVKLDHGIAPGVFESGRYVVFDSLAIDTGPVEGGEKPGDSIIHLAGFNAENAHIVEFGSIILSNGETFVITHQDQTFKIKNTDGSTTVKAKRAVGGL